MAQKVLAADNKISLKFLVYDEKEVSSTFQNFCINKVFHKKEQTIVFFAKNAPRPGSGFENSEF